MTRGDSQTGCICSGGAQLAIDTILVLVLHCDGSTLARIANVDGAATVVARRRKERTHPKLVGQRARTLSGVLAGEVGGRRNQEFSEPGREGQGETDAHCPPSPYRAGLDVVKPCCHAPPPMHSLHLSLSCGEVKAPMVTRPAPMRCRTPSNKLV